MIRMDEDALICDLAETYHLFDYRQLPPSKVAVLAVGLRDNSRIKLKINNMTIDMHTVLLASLVDRTSFLLWQQAKKGTPKPESILEKLLNKEKNVDHVVFDSVDEFEETRKRIIEERRKTWQQN